MPELTRRRSTEAREECWHIYYGERRNDRDPHGQPPSAPAATFDQARSDFEAAWKVFLANRTEADFQASRDQRDWTARKYALWDAGKKLEPSSHGPGLPAHRFRKCPCGGVFDMRALEENLVHVPHISAAEAQHVQ